MLTIDGKQVCESLAEVVDPRRAALAVIDIENVPRWDEGPDRVIFDQVRVHPGLEPREGDHVLPKHRGCAFEGTDFDLMLRTLRRESVVLVGCSTDWCLEATAWSAANKDYYVAVVGDCTRSPRPAGHEAALRQFRDIGLDVTTSEELLSLWKG